MAEIFISYSRRDSEHARSLADRLRAGGANVWLDTSSLTAADTWSAEIVGAIEQCTVFIVLLSNDSVTSENVSKELSLASESRKTIVPIELSDCEPNPAMKYALAGLQKVRMSDEVALRRAFAKWGILEENSAVGTTSEHAQIVHPPVAGPDELIKRINDSIRIAVLPFDDQSPQHDNEWFSDGLTDELISTLGKLDKLFVTDSQTTRAYKGTKLATTAVAAALRVEFVVRGAVRKAGNNLRIHATLIEAATGATLWDEKFAGTMDDIFDIQERTALDIAKGMKLQLTNEEVADIEGRGTASVEAYEYCLRAMSLIAVSNDNPMRVIELFEQAIKADPEYPLPYAGLSVAYANMYRSRGRTPEILALQRQAAEKAVQLAPDSIGAFNARANLYVNTGETDKATAMARQMVEKSPNNSRGYSVVGFMHLELGRAQEAIPWFERALAINPASIGDHNSLCASYFFANDMEGMRRAVLRALPHYEQFLALQPEEQAVRCIKMISLETIGEHAHAEAEIDRLLRDPNISGHSYYQIASVYSHQGKTDLSIEYLRSAAKMDGVNWAELRSDKAFFGSLMALPNFEELINELELLVPKKN